MTPMTVAEPFQKAMAAMNSSWIFTSATLAVGGDFSHFRGQLGIEDTEELQVDSPFDYRHNALLYLPEGLPEPCLLYTSPSPRDQRGSRMPSSA